MGLTEAIRRWKTGQIVWSPMLGGVGLGPSYEQGIQILLWESLVRWNFNNPPVIEDGAFSSQWNKHVDKVAEDLDKDCGFSGAQVGQARTVAAQFITYGYPDMMAKLEEGRAMQISKHFPKAPPVEK